MPELPDIVVYCEALASRLVGQPLLGVRVRTPFVLRSFDPPISAANGKRVRAIRRLGKRLIWELDDELFLVVHLMVAGRFKWKEGAPGAGVPGKVGVAAFDFPNGTLLLTEASMKKRASIHLVRGVAGLEPHSRGGLEVLETDVATFRAVLTKENHTLKRSLTDPRLFSGIGNAYSDEILHRARISPVKQTSRMTEEEIGRLYDATRTVLTEWTERLRKEAEKGFPEKVTAFREEMAVHGKWGKPCPDCGSKVQRIVHAENETNYCATCQTDGRLLADRALSRLLKSDWPRSLEDLEDFKEERKTKVEDQGEAQSGYASVAPRIVTSSSTTGVRTKKTRKV